MRQPSFLSEPLRQRANSLSKRPHYRLRPMRQFLGIWLVLRLLMSLWAAFVSPIRPLTELEQAIPLWPPSGSVKLWLERALLAPWQRWDSVYYMNIVSNGYRLDNGTSQFHPLFPWLAKPFNWVLGQPLFSLLIVSSIATIALIFAFQSLARSDLPPPAVKSSILFLLFSPPAFIFFAPYAESLFLLWAVLSFFWARKQSWWLAGLAGMMATLTRQQGVLLIFPLAWELWEATGRNPRRALAAWRNWLYLALIPSGLVIWIIYRALALGDVQADFDNLQTAIYSIVISPSSSKVVPVQAFLWPWQALWLALAKLWAEFEISLAIDLVIAGLYLVSLVLAWRQVRISYRIYALIIVLISFAYYTGPFYPYMGLPRHLLLAFPIFIGLGRLLPNRRRWPIIVGLGLLGNFLLLLLYVIEGWVP